MMNSDEIVIELRMLQRDAARLEQGQKENYGLIKEIAGKQILMNRLEELNGIVLRHAREIGKLAEGIQALKEALSDASDEELAEAAKKITINIDNQANNSGK